MFRALATSLLVTGLLGGGRVTAEQPHSLSPASLPGPGKSGGADRRVRVRRMHAGRRAFGHFGTGWPSRLSG
jgi:hypothetical protein